MSKKYGQVFLKSRRLAERIVDELHVNPEDWVVEVGPGKGILTEILIERATRVIGVELDTILATYLRERFIEHHNLIVINKDIRDFDMSQYPDVKVIGNIPYYLSGEFIFYLIENVEYWREAVIMVQKEFGDRLISKPGRKSYGAITVLVKKELDVEFLFYVGKGNFRPIPRVNSVLLRLRPDKKLPDIPFDGFARLVKAAFSTRRKKMLNNLVRELKINKDRLVETFLSLGFPLDIRAEYLSMGDFASLYHALYSLLSHTH